MLDKVRKKTLSAGATFATPYISMVFFGASQPWKATIPLMPTTVL